ncbi:MAG: aldehyde dehydrogenase family protein [Acidobacteriota bacterium]|nr:aldehyde dehydrogenase family protein [Acidobacteriota bacterium]
MAAERVWIGGRWRAAKAVSSFGATNPATGQPLEGEFPVSGWQDCDEALMASASAARALRLAEPEELARFLDLYASTIESRADALVARAGAETGLAISPRLRDVELPRTCTQLRQAAAAAREGTWQSVVIDTKANIRSHYAPIGPVVVMGPNNFPFAFHGVSGGDLAAAVAAGCPVIAKGHPLHPGTTQLLAECAAEALAQTSLPPATVQMLYHIGNEDGLRLVADPRVGATSFTGSRIGGLRLKAAADAAGRPIYLELSSLNPVVLLPGAVAERGAQLATELADSCLAGTGQFCTSPNLILALAGEATERLAEELRRILEERPAGALFSAGGLEGLDSGVRWLRSAGAEVLTGGAAAGGAGFRYKNTLLRVSGEDFLTASGPLQHEAFGNATMLVVANEPAELLDVIAALEGNLTGCIYSASQAAGDSDASIYGTVASALRNKVGRLLNDKMPTGVALSPAMNHGGPFPSTAHPGFTAVGIPRSMLRFGALECYDSVRPERLPAALRDASPNPAMGRTIDGVWVKG